MKNFAKILISIIVVFLYDIAYANPFNIIDNIVIDGKNVSLQTSLSHSVNGIYSFRDNKIHGRTNFERCVGNMRINIGTSGWTDFKKGITQPSFSMRQSHQCINKNVQRNNQYDDQFIKDYYKHKKYGENFEYNERQDLLGAIIGNFDG